MGGHTGDASPAENQKLLTRELQHRTKNLIAVIQSIARGSIPATDPQRDAFRGRSAGPRGGTNLADEGELEWCSVGGRRRRELAGFGGRISIDGPRVFLRPNAVQGFTLVVHELATNAAKHGALSAAEGEISVKLVRSESN